MHETNSPGAPSASSPAASGHSNVAIVGYGPVGATLAGLLARAGLSVRVYEKSTEIYPQPRAVGFDHDAMRLFQRVGVADDLAPHVAPFRDGIYYGAQGQVIQRVRRITPPYPLTWEPNYTCDQPGVEAVLRAALANMPNVNVSLGRELTDFSDDGTRMTLRSNDAQGRQYEETADYLVACDGASSPVRRKLGIPLASMDYDEPWIVVDVIVNPDCLHLVPETNVQYCEPTRPSSFITCPGTHRRWEFMTLPGEADQPVTEERLWRLLSRWLKPEQARIWRAAAYRFHALIAEDWRRGRVLLAGDSAHQTPPFLGQGMCQGLRDAGNIAWKLEQVIRGAAPDTLLDSYTAERRPHVEETTRLAKTFGGIISERDEEAARQRDTRMLATGPNGTPGEPRTLWRQELIPGLTTGLISSHAPLAGKVFPQPRVTAPGAAPDSTPMLMDELTGPAWRLVLGARKAEYARLAEQHNLPLIMVGPTSLPRADDVIAVAEGDGLLAAWLEANHCTGALVRPDHYTYGGFATFAQAQALLAEFAAQVPGAARASPTPQLAQATG